MPKAYPKGRRFEYLIRDLLNQAGIKTYRNFGSGGIGMYKGDLTTPNCPIHWELKHHNKWDMMGFYRQAQKDKPIGQQTIVIVVKSDRTEPFAFLDFDSFVSLLVYALSAGWPNSLLDNT